MRAAIYARISADREGAGLGVARQRADCEQLAEREGWDVAVVHVDNDISAYSGAERPGYRALLEDIAGGRVDAVIAWHVDRLHRSVADLEDFIVAVEAARVEVRTVMAGLIDLSTAAGRMQARIGAVIARHESEQKAERLRRKHVELAESGRPHGGPRGYGYTAGDMEVVPEEAAIIRETAERVLAGESVTSIARTLNDRGVPGAKGKPGTWSYQVLQRLLSSGRVAGLRRHRGEIVGPASWEPIIDRDTHERLRARLAPGRRTGPRVRTRLLTGLVVCGRCGVRLYARSREGGRRYYRCEAEPGRGQGTACGRLSVVSDPVDVFVGQEVIDTIEGARLGDALAALRGQVTGADVVAGLTEDEARLEELATDYASGDLTRAEWRAARGKLVERIEAARARLTADRGLEALAGIPEGVAAWWEAADLQARRVVVEALVDRVVVAPIGSRSGGRFDPDRVTVEWRYG